MCEKESKCAWCNKPATDLQLVWDDEVCESCLAQFAEETGRVTYQGRICQAVVDAGAKPVELPAVDSHKELEEELLDDIARVHGRCECMTDGLVDCWRVKCEDCGNPGPGAKTLEEARTLALAEEFVATESGFMCTNCLAQRMTAEQFRNLEQPACTGCPSVETCDQTPCEDDSLDEDRRAMMTLIGNVVDKEKSDQPQLFEGDLDAASIWKSRCNRLQREYGLLMEQIKRATTLWSHTIEHWRRNGQDEHDLAPLMKKVMRLLGNRVEEYEKRREEDRK